MAKQILSAFIQQSLQFDCRTEYEAYILGLKNGKTKYSVSDFKMNDDGKVLVTVRKQYNKNVFPDTEQEGSV